MCLLRAHRFRSRALAEASGLSEEELEQIVADNTTGKLLGIVGEEAVNVLGVNLDIAAAMGLWGKSPSDPHFPHGA